MFCNHAHDILSKVFLPRMRDNNHIVFTCMQTAMYVCKISFHTFTFYVKVLEPSSHCGHHSQKECEQYLVFMVVQDHDNGIDD